MSCVSSHDDDHGYYDDGYYDDDDDDDDDAQRQVDALQMSQGNILMREFTSLEMRHKWA